MSDDDCGRSANLFAVNCGVSIPLRDLNRYMTNGYSKYNEKLHGIATCGNWEGDAMELYDINEDKWIVIKNGLFCKVNGIFIGEDNPNLVSFIAK